MEMPKLAWGARGREFESRHADHFLPMKSTGYSPQGCDPFFFVPMTPIFSHTFSHTAEFAWLAVLSPITSSSVATSNSHLTAVLNSN